MLPQYDNQVVSSTYLWLDNLLTRVGSGFSNVSGLFFGTNSLYNGYTTLNSPFGQIVSDFSVSGAQILTGVYLNGVFNTTGTSSGLSQIDYANSRLYFNSGINFRVSGNYAIKDFNIKILTDVEERVIYETEHFLRPKIGQTLTGINTNQVLYPVIYLKNENSLNKPLSFGGLDWTINNIKLVIMSDSQFKSDAVSSLLRDQIRKNVPLLTESQFPFNIYGGYGTSGNYNYLNVTANSVATNNYCFINNIIISQFSRELRLAVNILNPRVFLSMIEIELYKSRYH